MQTVKKFGLIWFAVTSTLSATCYALEESFASLLAVGKTFITALPPSIEVTSTQAIYLRESIALPFPDTQCMYTGIEKEQMCFGDNRLTRIRFPPQKNLKLGLSPQSISQLKYNVSFSPRIPEQIIFPEFGSESEDIIAEIQLGAERQREITEQAKLNRLRLLLSPEEGIGRLESEYAQEEEDKTTQWYALEESLNKTDDANEATVRYEERIHEGIPLKPDTSYCITPSLDNKTQTRSAAPCDGESGGEDNNQTTQQEGSDGEESTSSDQKSDNGSNDECRITDVEPGFYVSPEVAQYCDMLELDEIKQEPVSDDEIPLGLEDTVTTEATSVLAPENPPPSKKKKLPHAGRLHQAQMHGVGGKECGIDGCKKRFTRPADTTSHQAEVHGVGGEECGIDDCKKRFTNPSQKKSHQAQVHGMAPKKRKRTRITEDDD